MPIGGLTHAAPPLLHFPASATVGELGESPSRRGDNSHQAGTPSQRSRNHPALAHNESQGLRPWTPSHSITHDAPTPQRVPTTFLAVRAIRRDEIPGRQSSIFNQNFD